MTYQSSTDPRFLSELRAWLQESGELLVLFRYSHAAGNRDFEFYTSYPVLIDRIRALQPRTCITAFKERQLPIRGVVDDALVERSVRSIPDGNEYLIVETVRRDYGKQSWFHHDAGVSHASLREDLDESRGVPVAVGPFPSWLVDTTSVTSAVVPHESGVVELGVY